MGTVRNVYKVVRSVLFATVVAVAILFILLYTALSTPWVTDRIRNVAEQQLTAFFHAPVSIGDADIRPFNEVRLSDVTFTSPEGDKCLTVERLGAGISLWQLLIKRNVVITYAELVGLDAHISQARKDGPYNIQFIIDAFKPKKKGTPPTRFDLKLHNVVIRKSAVSFDRLWAPRSGRQLDFNHLALSDIRADVAMPRLSNENYQINLRRLSLREKSGLYIDALSFQASVSPHEMTIRDFSLKLDRMDMKLNDLQYKINGFASIPRTLASAEHDLHLRVQNLTPDELSFILPGLEAVGGSFNIDADLQGTLENITVRRLSVINPSDGAGLELEGNVMGLPDLDVVSGSVTKLQLDAGSNLTNQIISLFPSVKDNIPQLISKCKSAFVDVEGSFSMSDKTAWLKGEAGVAQGKLSIDGLVNWRDGVTSDLKLSTESFRLGELLDNQPVNNIAMNLQAKVGVHNKDIVGDADIQVPTLTLNGRELQNISVTASKKGSALHCLVESDCALAKGRIDAEAVLAGVASSWELQAVADHVNLPALGVHGKYAGMLGVRSLIASATGNSPANLAGEVYLDDLSLQCPDADDIALKNLWLSVRGDDMYRSIDIESDVLAGNVDGTFSYKDAPALVSEVLAYALPSYIKAPNRKSASDQWINFRLTAKPDEPIYKALNAGLAPVENVTLTGKIKPDMIKVAVDAPYLLKGSDKLIKGTTLQATATPESGLDIEVKSKLPGKKNSISSYLTSKVLEDKIKANVGWDFDGGTDRGSLNVAMDVRNNPGQPVALLFDIHDSDIVINGEKWDVKPADALFSENVLSVNNLEICHGDQLLHVNGRASASPNDTLKAKLRDIDLSYIFNTLNINYVTFGGHATGNAIATSLFSKHPVARTEGLKVRDFSYNNAILGNADLEGSWDNASKSIGIRAAILNQDNLITKADGRVYIGGDSLRFKFDANKINIALIKPFVAGFLDDVQGKATGQLTLFGTFKNIGLVGKAFADSASVKVGYTNVTYHGSDSLLFYIDRISIPGFKVYDRYGNTAMVRGDVRHDFFHNARIDMNFTDVRRLLCFDTDSRMNPVWWGRIFANGSGRISGRPGYTLLSFNVNPAPESSFTFSLDETETASEYTFLTFSDKKKEESIIMIDESLEEKYSKKKTESQDDKSVFELDMAVGVSPNIKMNVIMDPSAGDKISATGNGALRINYNSFVDNLNVFGRYEIDNGSYRFSFQDIILRDFNISRGSSISFNGDPLQGILDLTAAYRVNTNLTDLDKSFATDRELNRSSIPVDALLKVTGNLTHPDIAFDIALPTMTADVERKVRSIVSSEEMLNQQVLYLLALNRFYTPQFAGNSDGELVSVASSTISSQISNMLSQITDKVSLNPSFKSDRNDFSDMEVDLALSSQLFDNRLIINGNLGYRDRSVSQSTFIGDFDIEYLLSRNGALRLKAYNHFNDAYYYLKSALTTQGIGLIYRKDFNDPFAFLKHRPKRKIRIPVPKASRDSITEDKKK